MQKKKKFAIQLIKKKSFYELLLHFLNFIFFYFIWFNVLTLRITEDFH